MPALSALGRYWIGNRGHTLRPPDSRWDNANYNTAEHVAEFVTWLCTDAAAHINGSAFYVGGSEIGLVTEPEVERSLVRPGTWSVEEMDRFAGELTFDLYDRFRVDVPTEDV
jgi:hypothetical protein